MITTNIRPINVQTQHHITGNVTTQSQQQITSGGLDTNVETDPIFRHSAAYNITDTDIQRWDAASGGIDLSAYVTHTFLSEQAYLTSESDPIFSASPAAGITNEDIENWNAGGAVDLSSYVTYDYLSAQAYLTSVTFPDYSNTYQAKGDYITPEVLAQQSYLTTETEPAFNSSPASTITDTDITNWNAAAGTIDMSAYVTKSELVTQSYITINDVVFPDYNNTYQAKGNYLTNETDPVFSASPAAGITTQDITNWNTSASVDLSSYVTKSELSAQSYLTSESDPIFSASPAAGITTQDIQRWDNGGGSVDLSSYVTYDYLSAQAYLTSVTFPDYSNTYQTKGNYLTSETDPVFSASAAAGITAQDIINWNNGGGVDLSDYVTYEFLSSQAYLTSVTFPDYSSTYQSKGDYITPATLVAQAYITTETDPVFSASPAAGITTQDIQNWNNGSGVDLSSYVSYNYLSAQAYVTAAQLVAQSYITSVTFPDYSNTYQAKGNYLTSETDPVFSASPAAGITAQDITNWNTCAGLDLSSYVTYTYIGQTLASYVTYEYLSAQAYLTSVTFPDYSNTYQAKGDYITPTDLVNCSYAAVKLVTQSQYQDQQDDVLYVITDAEPIDVSNYVKKDELAAQSYITQTTLSSQSYITPAVLVAQSYITSVTFPDYSNTYQAKGDYITPTILDSQAYVTPATLAAQSYITTTPDYFTTYTSYAYFYSYINLKLGDIETLLSQI